MAYGDSEHDEALRTARLRGRRIGADRRFRL